MTEIYDKFVVLNSPFVEEFYGLYQITFRLSPLSLRSKLPPTFRMCLMSHIILSYLNFTTWVMPQLKSVHIYRESVKLRVLEDNIILFQVVIVVIEVIMSVNATVTVVILTCQLHAFSCIAKFLIRWEMMMMMMKRCDFCQICELWTTFCVPQKRESNENNWNILILLIP